MQQSDKAIVWFDEISKDNISIAGGKGANLGEMTAAGIPVPPGFIVTANAYFDFLEKANLSDSIAQLLEQLDSNDNKELNRIAFEVKKLILDSTVPEKLAKQIKHAYNKLGRGLVAVRSSATAEDLPEASFAGQQSTFLNIEGGDEVVNAVLKCWASLFEPRAIYYREQQGFDHFKLGIAVPVQRMVQSKSSGVIFTIEPITSDPDKIILEAIYGLGEGLVSGEIKPDLYFVDKASLSIISKRISHQEKQ